MDEKSDGAVSPCGANETNPRRAALIREGATDEAIGSPGATHLEHRAAPHCSTCAGKAENSSTIPEEPGGWDRSNVSARTLGGLGWASVPAKTGQCDLAVDPVGAASRRTSRPLVGQPPAYHELRDEGVVGRV
jgi:hypothetical protein